MISTPALNAVLNGASAILVTLGYVMIRTKRIVAHWKASHDRGRTVTSAAFLFSYVTYHYRLYAAGQSSASFSGDGRAALRVPDHATDVAYHPGHRHRLPLVILSLACAALRSNLLRTSVSRAGRAARCGPMSP